MLIVPKAPAEGPAGHEPTAGGLRAEETSSQIAIKSLEKVHTISLQEVVHVGTFSILVTLCSIARLGMEMHKS